MIQRAASIALFVYATAQICGAQTPVWVVHSLPTKSAEAVPLLLQADGDAAPEWGILNENEIVIAEIPPDSPTWKVSLPAGTALFDLRDINRDGKIELATVRGGRLEYWPDAISGTRADPAFFIEDASIAAISIGGPRPYPLFLKDRGEDYITVPIGDTPPIMTLDGTPLPAPITLPPRPPVQTQFHAWSSPPDKSANQLGEIRINLRYEREASKSGQTANVPPAPLGGGNRRARDASSAPYDDWPWFTLSDTSRVSYALAPPDFRDTLIRVDRRDTTRPKSESEPNARRFPGILIAPGAAGSDFNGDGYNDLLFWRAPRPGASLNALVRAAQDGDWEVELTVHLFDPVSGRFDARPVDWIHTKAPLEGVLSSGVRGPFDYLSIEDINGDARADLLCSGAGYELSAWTFSGKRETAPWTSVRLREPIEDVVLIARVQGFHWLGILRSAHAFQLAALPKR